MNGNKIQFNSVKEVNNFLDKTSHDIIGYIIKNPVSERSILFGIDYKDTPEIEINEDIIESVHILSCDYKLKPGTFKAKITLVNASKNPSVSTIICLLQKMSGIGNNLKSCNCKIKKKGIQMNEQGWYYGICYESGSGRWGGPFDTENECEYWYRRAYGNGDGVDFMIEPFYEFVAPTGNVCDL